MLPLPSIKINLMKTFLFALVSALCLACNNAPTGQKVKASDQSDAVAQAPMEAETYHITSGQINWTASKPTGQHLGTVEIAGGSIASKGNDVLSGSFDVNMSSIRNIDLDEGNGKEKLEGHLKSADFFDVENNPQATFVVTKATPVSDQAMATHNVTGNLMIKGISKSVTIPANISFVGNKMLTATPAFTIDRTQWNIKYNSGIIGTAADKLIHDEVSLVITFEAIKS